jgi:hypothetical protein
MALRSLLSLALVYGIATSAFAQDGDELRIDHIDIKRYAQEGIIRFYVDILDQEQRVIGKQDENNLTFFINDEPIDSDIIQGRELRQFDEVGEPLAVGILFTNYAGFVPVNSSETSLFGFAKRGIIEFIRKLRGGTDMVALWLYNEDGMRYLHPFANNMKDAAQVVESLGDSRRIEISAGDSDDRTVKTPNFYRFFDEVVTKMAEVELLPRRKILILVSDGVGEYDAKRQKRLDRKLKQTIEAAQDAGIKIYVFGATLQEDAFMPSLKLAASDTEGIFRRFDDPDALQSAIRELAQQLMKQYVVDLVAPGLPSDEKVQFRINAETANNRTAKGPYRKRLQLPETPTNWMEILKWIGFVIGSLLGVFFFVWLIKKLIAWRSNRPQEVYVEEAYQYDGPDRGRLIVRSGHMAGTEFPLLEEVTTIGSIEGNHVVLYDESVSKRHAGIRIEDMRYELADFGSTNHTWVNGRKINKQFLRDGDEIRIGSVELEFRLK